MTNTIGYNQFPDKNEFITLYKNSTQLQLCNYYKCNKKRINKWIKHFGLELRPQGGGNNRKYEVNEHILRKLIDDGYSNDEICNALNIKGKSSLYVWIRKFNIKRKKETDKYKLYKHKVRYLTEKTYALYKNEINPNNYPRTLCGVDNGYQLDHVISVSECFKKNIPEDYCASKENLQMLSWIDNLRKRYE